MDYARATKLVALTSPDSGSAKIGIGIQYVIWAQAPSSLADFASNLIVTHKV